MSFGPIGAMLIDKGIDQFSWGVGQEYRRHERHKLRDYQNEDKIYNRINQKEDRWQDRKWQLEDQKWQSKEFERKMDMANKFGIHPLAMLQSSGNSPVVSRPSSFGGSTGGSARPGGGNTPSSSHNIGQPRLNKDQQRILNAQARKTEAEASLIEQQVKQVGQNPDNFQVGSLDQVQGQTDSDMFSPSPKSAVGVESKVTKAQKYTVDREGNFYIIPSQSSQEAFSDEGTIQNRFLYQMRDAKFPMKVASLKHHWNHPQKQEFKRRFLATRPRSRNSNEVVLWNGSNWQAFKRTPRNANRIFSSGYQTYKPNKRKIRHESTPYNELPMS